MDANETRRKVKRIIFALVSLFCLFSIMSSPVNKYEWMLDEDPNITLKSLPIDNNASTYPWFAIAPISLLVVCILIAKNSRERKVLIGVCVILLGIWTYKFRAVLLF